MLIFLQELPAAVLCLGQDLEKFYDQSIALHLEDLIATLRKPDLPFEVDQFRTGRLDIAQRHGYPLLLLCTGL